MDKTRLMVDGHVHIYDCYDLETFFQNAVKNLDYYHNKLYPEESGFERILLLTEGKKVDFFSAFKTGKGSADVNFSGTSGYSFKKTDEECSLVLTHDDKPLCYLLKGRQIVTAENLEVLLVASSLEIEDGKPIDDVLRQIGDENQLAILTWGFGKWFFKRGDIIKEAINKFAAPNLFIGDNSGRPDFWPIPPQFKQAAKENLPILNGSDPLPFQEEVNKVGTYGFAVEAEFNHREPAASLRQILTEGNNYISLFGQRDNVVSFTKRQAKMHLKKHRKK